MWYPPSLCTPFAGPLTVAGQLVAMVRPRWFQFSLPALDSSLHVPPTIDTPPSCRLAIDVEQLNETCSGPRSYIWLFGMALGFWAAHQLVYAILVQVCCLRFLRKRPDYETSYRYLMRSKGLVFRIATCCGRYQSKKWKPIGFAAVSVHCATCLAHCSLTAKVCRCSSFTPW